MCCHKSLVYAAVCVCVISLITVIVSYLCTVSDHWCRMQHPVSFTAFSQFWYLRAFSKCMVHGFFFIHLLKSTGNLSGLGLRPRPVDQWLHWSHTGYNGSSLGHVPTTSRRATDQQHSASVVNSCCAPVMTIACYDALEIVMRYYYYYSHQSTFGKQ